LKENIKIDFKTLRYSFLVPSIKINIKYFYAPWAFMATWALYIKAGFRNFISSNKILLGFQNF
jgi:hypothetical protein